MTCGRGYQSGVMPLPERLQANMLTAELRIQNWHGNASLIMLQYILLI